MRPTPDLSQLEDFPDLNPVFREVLGQHYFIVFNPATGVWNTFECVKHDRCPAKLVIDWHDEQVEFLPDGFAGRGLSQTESKFAMRTMPSAA